MSSLDRFSDFILVLVSIFIFLVVITTTDWVSFKKTKTEPQQAQLGLPAMKYPEDNPITPEKVALGRKLFMDRRLSHTDTQSCAMCHIPEQGFTANEIKTAVGLEGRTGRRNSPTILNVGYDVLLFHDGRESRLEDQIFGPLLATNEMDNPSVGYIVQKVRSLPDYQNMFEKAFDGQKANIELIGKAIASYERTLVSGNSRFDRWYFGKESNALTTEEQKGFAIFMGKGHCVACHTINKDSALFLDQSLHNTGIGWKKNNKALEDTIDVQLAPRVKVTVPAKVVETASEPVPNDVGRYEITLDPKDRWLYKTPTLRNIALTAPYMHDGSLSTLEDVVNFYDRGGEDNPNKDPMLKPLGLTESEKQELVLFMKTLTGSNVESLVKDARNAYPNGANITASFSK